MLPSQPPTCQRPGHTRGSGRPRCPLCQRLPWRPSPSPVRRPPTPPHQQQPPCQLLLSRQQPPPLPPPRLLQLPCQRSPPSMQPRIHRPLQPPSQTFARAGSQRAPSRHRTVRCIQQTRGCVLVIRRQSWGAIVAHHDVGFRAPRSRISVGASAMGLRGWRAPGAAATPTTAKLREPQFPSAEVGPHSAHAWRLLGRPRSERH